MRLGKFPNKNENTSCLLSNAESISVQTKENKKQFCLNLSFIRLQNSNAVCPLEKNNLHLLKSSCMTSLIREVVPGFVPCMLKIYQMCSLIGGYWNAGVQGVFRGWGWPVQELLKTRALTQRGILVFRASCIELRAHLSRDCVADTG